MNSLLLLPLAVIGGNSATVQVQETVRVARFVSLVTALTTSAIVGVRVMRLMWQDKNLRLKSNVAVLNGQADSLTRTYVFGSTGSPYLGQLGFTIAVHTPFKMVAESGDFVSLVIDGADAGDTLSIFDTNLFLEEVTYLES